MTKQTKTEKLAYLIYNHGEQKHKNCDLCFLVDLVLDQRNAITRILNSEVRIQREMPSGTSSIGNRGTADPEPDVQYGPSGRRGWPGRPGGNEPRN